MSAPEMINAGEIVLKKYELEWVDVATAAVRESLPELRRFMVWATDDYDVDSAREFIERSGKEWRDGAAYQYGVFTTAGELVGSAGLMSQRVGPGELEVGYWTHSAHTGRGYATKAAATLAQVGLSLSLPGIERIVIKHDAANPASGAVAARAGFTEVGRGEREPETAEGSGVEVIWEYTRASG